MAIPISEKIDFKIKIIKRHKGHYIRRKRPIHQEAVIIINIHVPNKRAPKNYEAKIYRNKGETV